MLVMPLVQPPDMHFPADDELPTEEQRRIRDIDAGEIWNPDRLNNLKYRMRLGFMRDLIRRNVSVGGIVLDVGCAQGNAALMMREDGYRVIALDLRWDFVRYARTKGRGLLAVVSNGEQLPLRAGTVDGVILGEVLEHVAHPDRFLREAARVLRPGGLLVASTPNGASETSSLPTWHEVEGRAKEFEGRQFRPDVDGHLFLYTEEELRGLLHASGFADARFFHYFSRPVAAICFKTSRYRTWAIVSRHLSPTVARTLALLDQTLVPRRTRPRLAAAVVVAARTATLAAASCRHPR